MIEADTLDEVVVTATRSRWQLSSLPLSALRITGADVQSMGAMRLGEVLEEQTGITTVSSYGGGTGIQLQGMGSEHVLILLDGVPLVGRQAGTLDLNRLSVAGVQQVEVVHGASSSLYGSEALGGVVNIITQRRALEGWRGQAMHRYGRFQTHDSQIQGAYGSERFSVGGFVNRYSSQGYGFPGVSSTPAVMPFNTWSMQGHAAYHAPKGGQVRLSARHYREDQNLLLAEEAQGAGRIREWNTRLQVDTPTQSWWQGRWQGGLDLYLTRYAANEYALGEGPAPKQEQINQFLQHFVQGQVQGSFEPRASIRFSAGLGWRYETLDRTAFQRTPFQQAPYLYAQYEGMPHAKWRIVAGMRLDVHSQYPSQLSPKLALRYALDDAWAVSASFGRGFKAPDFRQLYFDFSNATGGYIVLGQQVRDEKFASPDIQIQTSGSTNNEDPLRPEQASTYHFAFSYNPKQALKIKLSAFRNDLQNLIDTYLVGYTSGGQAVFSYYNASRVYTQGLSLDAQTYVWQRRLRIAGGYQLLYAYDKAVLDVFRAGKAFVRDPETKQSVRLRASDYFGLLNRSRHMANVKVFYEWLKPQLHANLRVTYRSRYGRLDTNHNGYLDTKDDFASGYVTMDWGASKTFYGNYVLGFGIDNLLNFTDPLHLPQLAGRLWYVNLRVIF